MTLLAFAARYWKEAAVLVLVAGLSVALQLARYEAAAARAEASAASAALAACQSAKADAVAQLTTIEQASKVLADKSAAAVQDAAVQRARVERRLMAQAVKPLAADCPAAIAELAAAVGAE